MSSPTAIVPLNPAEPFAPKPLIADILRTRYCIAGSVFLVEGVDASVPVGRKHRAVRLLLGDGELCIQGLLAPEAHFYVDIGQVRAGCYVKIQTFEARWMDAQKADGALGKQTTSSRIIYLLVEDVETVGWNSDYLRMLKEHVESSAMPEALGEEDSTREEMSADAPASQPKKSGTSTGEIQDAAEYDVDSDFETMIVSEEEATKRRIGPEAKDARPPSQQGGSGPWMSCYPTQPLKLTPLRLIANLPFKQNWVVNVLAIVVSISGIELSHIPPRMQRSVRLADMSTTKHVLLTVCLDPQGFCPKVGSAVLLTGVKSHSYDGGSLKKYPTDRPKNHDNWWVEDPDLEWFDVGALKSWWASRGG